MSNGRITDTLKLNEIDIPSTPGRLNNLLNSTSWFQWLPFAKSHSGVGVLIRVAAASLNPSDYKLIAHGSANFLVRKPGIPGFDFAGVVVCELGTNQSEHKFVPGTRVYGHLIPEWKILLVRLYFSTIPHSITKILFIAGPGNRHTSRIHRRISSINTSYTGFIILRSQFVGIFGRYYELASTR